MDFRLLKYFWTIAEEGTVSRAADILHITQPTLSRQLKELEEELGTELFVREKKKMILTEAGLFLKSRAEEILSLTNQTKQEFENRRNQLFSGHISIGCVEADNSDTLATMLEELVSDYPQVTFHIFSGTSDDITEKLDKGLIDLAILLEPISLDKYESLTLPRTERWGLLASNESFLAQKSSITKDDLLGVPLLTSKRQEIQQMLAKWVGKPLDELTIVGTYNLIFNVISLVDNKVGSAITIEGSVSNHNLERVTFIPLEPEVKTNCVLVWKRNRVLSPVVKKFIQRFKYAYGA